MSQPPTIPHFYILEREIEMDQLLVETRKEFDLECVARLEQKKLQGCYDWEKMSELELRIRLYKNLEQAVPDYVDVSNLSMMLWYKFGRV
jgi:hypothetical protein